MIRKAHRYTLTLATAIATLLIEVPAFASEDQFEGKQGTEVLGKEMSGTFTAGVPTDSQTVKTKAKITVLGIAMEALMASMQPANTIGGKTYTEFYSFGKRIFSNSTTIEKSGLLKFRAGISPTEVRIPVYAYPVGPLLLQIDGGARFEANIIVQNSTEIAFPLQFANFAVDMQAVAAAAGFIEGYAKLFIVRAGVGGQLDLIDAHASVNARFTPSTKPLVLISAMVEFLKGRLYAFADVFWLSQMGWKRLWNYDLYNWNGYCFATDVNACPVKQ
ncbi:MAG: hypothetical protein AB7K68_06090 [Bacteriovoracia bacterium]